MEIFAFSRARVRHPQTIRRDSLSDVNVPRRCCRPGCPHYAVATLTFVYSDSTAVVGPLAAYTEPHCYDLCEGHASRLTAPLGWDVVRLPVHAGEALPAAAAIHSAPE